VFGRIVCEALRQIREQRSLPEPCTVADWGAGRGLMGGFLGEFRYLPVEAGQAAPPPFEGIVFANELFDALPVDVVRGTPDGTWMRRVAWREGAFCWIDAEPLEGEWREYAERLEQRLRENGEWILELPVRMEAVLRQISSVVRRGALVVIDYGYTEREVIRFPRGTLMSYRRHAASEDVLRNPGLQDITAHVPFTLLEEIAARMGWKAGRLENLSSWLLRAGGRGMFSGVLHADSEDEAVQLRLQLKTLLFGMGEAFRCLELWKEG
jgi:SAM-dependent MidA family methyltransferase